MGGRGGGPSAQEGSMAEGCTGVKGWSCTGLQFRRSRFNSCSCHKLPLGVPQLYHSFQCVRQERRCYASWSIRSLMPEMPEVQRAYLPKHVNITLPIDDICGENGIGHGNGLCFLLTASPLSSLHSAGTGNDGPLHSPTSLSHDHTNIERDIQREKESTSFKSTQVWI